MKITAKDQVRLIDNEPKRKSFRSELREIAQMSTEQNAIRMTKKRRKGVFKLRFDTKTMKDDVENEPDKKKRKEAKLDDKIMPILEKNLELEDRKIEKVDEEERNDETEDVGDKAESVRTDDLDDTIDSSSNIPDEDPLDAEQSETNSTSSRYFSPVGSSMRSESKPHKNKKPEYSFILEKFPTYGRTREQNNEVNRLRMQFLRARRKFIAMLEENGEPAENIDNYSEQDILNFAKPINRGSPTKEKQKESKPVNHRKIEKPSSSISNSSSNSNSISNPQQVIENESQDMTNEWMYATPSQQQIPQYQNDYTQIVQISNGILPGLESNRYNSSNETTSSSSSSAANYWEYSLSSSVPTNSEINLIESIRKRNLMYNNFENL